MSDDLIKRSDAIKAVWEPQVKPNELIFDALKTAIESGINNVPSADEPQGEWEIYVISPFDGEDCRCPKCGETGCVPSWNYCPNCGIRLSGARMKRSRR